MLKGLFSKYITAFMLIIAISFTAVIVMVTSMITNSALNEKKEAVRVSANSVKDFMENTYEKGHRVNFNQFVFYNFEVLYGSLSMVAQNTQDLIILITDATGRILISSEEHGTVSNNEIPAEFTANIQQNGCASGVDDLNGIFPSRYLVSGCSIHSTKEDDALIGMVVVGASSTDVSSLAESVLNTIVVSCLWVMVAALIAVYFITEKIISPLKAMSRAAKNYAAGIFDVRVPVNGRDEVAQLAMAFNNMANSLANAENLRQSFLANVSHDLRTPMTTIAGFIDGILDGAIPPEKQPYYLELIASEVRRLSRLVSSLLDISRIQAGDRKFTKTVFDICEMARQIIISFEQRIEEKKLDVVFACDFDKVMVYADRDAIHQVFYNLCDNAVKFSKSGGLYRIRIVEQNKKVYVSVYNEGQGIPENEIAYVFDRFYKSDKSRGLDKTGVGLGLYIVKTIIDAHNEEIWVKSAYGKYCEFMFTLQPANKSELKEKRLQI